MSMKILGIALLLFQVQPGNISGTVTRPGGTEPLPGATVVLNPSDLSQTSRVRSVISEDDGRFTIQNVEPGDYRLQAQSTQYGRAAYGQRRPDGPGAILTIAAGQRRSDLKISMVPTGTIAGNITGLSGEPLAYASVKALKLAYQDGKRTLATVQTTTTDDRGEYRLFWLTTGKYVVVAEPRSDAINSATLNLPTRPGEQSSTNVLLRTLLVQSQFPDGFNLVNRILEDGTIREESWMPTYFPGTTDRTQAISVDVPGGFTVNGINIAIGPSPVQKIRGRVAGSNSVARVTLARESQPTALRTYSTGLSTIDGSFEFSGVIPGPYSLTALDASGLRSRPVSVLVGERDVEGISLALEPPITVTVRVTVEGDSQDSPDALAGFSGTLQADLDLVPRPLAWNISTQIARRADGNVLVFPNAVPGDYQLGISQGLIRDNMKRLYVKSLRSGRDDALNTAHVSSDSNVFDLVLTTQTGSVEGVATGRAGDPAANATVVLVPTNARKRTAFYKILVTGADGKFRFQEIPPGDYKVFAWDDVETGAWQDADFIRQYESRGHAVHISESSNDELQLSVIYNP